MVTLLAVWWSPHSCSDSERTPPGASELWEPLGVSDFGPDDKTRQAEQPGGSATRRVRLGDGDALTIEWAEGSPFRYPGLGRIHTRRWDGERWSTSAPPLSLPSLERRRWHPTGGDWAVWLDAELHVLVDGAVQTLPEPERPTYTSHSCTSSSSFPYHGPATVVRDPTGRVLFLEPIAGELNAWRWTGDRWERLGPFHGADSGGGFDWDEPLRSRPAVAFETDGRPVVAWYDQATPIRPVLRSRRWAGDAWEDLGDIDIDPTGLRGEPPSMAAGDGRVVLTPTGTRSTAVYLHAGTWRREPLPGDGAVRNDAAVALLPDGRPVVARSDRGRLRADVLRGKRWSEAGSWPLTGPAPASPQLTAAPDGRVILTFFDRGLVALAWDGAQLSPLSAPRPRPTGLGGSEPAQLPMVVVDPEGHPTVAWVAGAAWSTARLRTWSGATWEPLPDAAIRRGARHLSLTEDGPALRFGEEVSGLRLVAEREVVDADGRSLGVPSDCVDESDGVWLDPEPLSVFALDATTGTLRTCAWTGSGWSRLPDLGVSLARPPRLAVAGGLVAWVEPDGAFDRIEVRAWDGAAWSSLGLAAECAGPCTGVDVAEGGGRVCVAWTERAGIGVRCRGR